MSNVPEGNFTTAWTNFVRATRSVLDRKRNQPGRGYVESYWPFAEGVLNQVGNPDFAATLGDRWRDYSTDRETARAAGLLLTELQSYPVMVDSIFPPTEEPGSRLRGSLKDALHIAKVIIDSIRNLLSLHPLGKAMLELYSEAIDIFKGA